MAEKRGASYGPASQEEHRASGYRLPDAFYQAPEVDDKGFPVERDVRNEDGSSISATEPGLSNKAVLPTRAPSEAPAEEPAKRRTPAARKATAKKAPARRK